ncbi:MAG: type II CAAX prenyl endopeptidase Rce1 family protein [Thermoproteus sp. AZ2]|uniref:Type II CAAX prenyl endopeptidase Rce1 family protein n=1 Tax=Thermoproteus sp. AZ2 TaxID=1609232 RepID=A0ACC6V0B2_9CREN
MRPLYLLIAFIAAVAVVYSLSYAGILGLRASEYLYIAVETAFFPAAFALKRRYSPRGLYDALPFLLLWFLAQPFLSYFTPSESAGSELLNLYESGVLPALIAATVVVEPVVQEALFRGILLEELARYGSAVAYIASSLVYALFVVQPVSLSSAVAFAAYFLLGLIFAYAYKRGG